ncbi:uncharacterized protein BYT42DRAFT_613454 [Radiomyces spectabilis]|uniref:uncharacterized protein n=1 Tax=Radiomyces spectabilis TaxID=64574 RepID=UPI0022205A84|nr:uncharacterized protein BYT42DRAFT_613454 [Radiomyces spectabilis]KAI8379123.1 hypothetical protein BYT42DRAFT_613454 [Radiomyces spectabilis]
MESHVYHLLSLSFIFLVIPGHFHNDLKKFIPSDKLAKIVNDLNTQFNIGQLKVKNEIICQLIDVASDLRTNKLDCDNAVIELLLLRKQSTKEEYRIIKSFASLIRSLPNEAVSNMILEQELISRFTAPALNPLFDDPQNDNLFRWIAAINEEMKTSSTVIVSNERPDACISVLDGSIWGVTRGFSEAKCHSQVENKYLLAKDLVHLGIFAKNSIDVNNIKGVLVMQVIGHRVFFYIVSLMYNDIYVMFEIAQLLIPAKISDLSLYAGQVNTILDIIWVYDNLCNAYEDNVLPATLNVRKRKTLSCEEHDHVVSDSRNRKRLSITTPSLQ